MKSLKSLIILDFDGTIVDNTLKNFDKMNQILERMKLSPVSEDFLQRIWGRRFKEIVVTILTESTGQKPPETLINNFIKIDQKIPIEITVIPDLLSVLRYIKRKGHCLGILTSRTRKDFQDAVKNFDHKLDIFDLIKTADDSQFHKPDHRVFEAIFNYSDKNRVTEIKYFGDTIYDWAAAFEATKPVEFIGVVSGAMSASDFYNLGVKEVVDGPLGIAEYLAAIYA